MADGGQSTDFSAFLARVGQIVRKERQRAKLSRRALAERSDVSERYLAQLESGAGNISILLLKRVADALDRPVATLIDDGNDTPLGSLVSRYLEATHATRARIDSLLDPDNPTGQKNRRVALIGLRGAGKSTLGQRVAHTLGCGFQELNSLIEDSSGMPVAEIIALYGQEGYRRLEKRALESVANQDGPVILAVAGGIVADPETFEYLLARFHTVWLKARPQEHMERVRAQGDERPMKGNPAAMAELRGILQAREALYARADDVIDTAGRDVNISANDVLTCVRGYLEG